MVRVHLYLEEKMSYGKIFTVATLTAEGKVLSRVRYLAHEENIEYNWKGDSLELTFESDVDVKIDDVKDTIISLVKKASEDIKNLKRIEIILDL